MATHAEGELQRRTAMSRIECRPEPDPVPPRAHAAMQGVDRDPQLDPGAQRDPEVDRGAQHRETAMPGVDREPQVDRDAQHREMRTRSDRPSGPLRAAAHSCKAGAFDRGAELRADLVPALAISAGTAVAFLPFAVALPVPALVALWLVSTAARSIAPVHQHCHAHRKVFQVRVLDAAYDAILALAAGNVTAVWEHQHVRGHHREYLERTRDPANNDRFGGGRVRFTILGDALSFVDSLRIADRRTLPRLVRQQLLQLAALAALLAIDPALAIAFFVVPWLLLRWIVFWFSYAQHDRVPMLDVYSGSVTHFGWTNRLYLNVGHHTAHHEKPTLHWTRLPARTARIIERIPDVCLR